MADYISKNEVLNLIMHNDKVCHYATARYENIVYATACKISDVVADMPAADVQPVRRGRWEKDEKRNSFEKFCSICKHEAYWDTDYGQQLFDYCPYCGARMMKDGDTDA